MSLSLHSVCVTAATPASTTDYAVIPLARGKLLRRLPLSGTTIALFALECTKAVSNIAKTKVIFALEHRKTI